jgi:hypothetical protein
MFVAGILGLNNEHTNDIDYIPLKTQEDVVDAIVKDANGKPFSLIRVGPFDYFPENYDQNYQYLLLILNKKLDKSATLRYTIYEDTSNLPQSEKIFWIENIAVSKNE